jgi:hypothetical protein
MDIPLIFSFWFMVAAYVIHVIDESLLGKQFRRESPATLVGGILMEKVLLVQHRVFRHHDRQRGRL